MGQEFAKKSQLIVGDVFPPMSTDFTQPRRTKLKRTSCWRPDLARTNVGMPCCHGWRTMTNSLQNPVPPFSGTTRSTLLGLCAIVAAAAALRTWAACDEFWLDEMWSLMAFTRIPHSFWDIFTFHHDNNHYFITLWMDVVGPAQRNWFVYRIPSVAASSGTVLLAGWIARRWGRFASFVATLLTASSFVLIVYGSEARGYALAGFFSLLAFLALDRYLASYRVVPALGFAVATLLGVLSHLTFVQFYCGGVGLVAAVDQGRALLATGLVASPSGARVAGCIFRCPVCH